MIYFMPLSQSYCAIFIWYENQVKLFFSQWKQGAYLLGNITPQIQSSITEVKG